MKFIDRLRGNVLPLFSEETRVARFVVLPESVGGITAPGGAINVIGSEWAPKFDLPGIVESHFSVLTFEAAPKAAGTRFTVRVSTGSGGHVVDHTFAGAERQLFHVVLRPAALRETLNEIIFNVAGDGTVQFSDAVIMYTSDQTTIKVPPVLQG